MIWMILVLAFFTHETNTGGQFKQCHYNAMGDTYTISVPAYKLCPLTIDV